MENKIKRYNNLYFWLGICGVILSSLNVNISEIHSWQELFEIFKSILLDPSKCLYIAMAVTGVCVDPTTKGIKDHK